MKSRLFSLRFRMIFHCVGVRPGLASLPKLLFQTSERQISTTCTLATRLKYSIRIRFQVCRRVRFSLSMPSFLTRTDHFIIFHYFAIIAEYAVFNDFRIYLSWPCARISHHSNIVTFSMDSLPPSKLLFFFISFLGGIELPKNLCRIQIISNIWCGRFDVFGTHIAHSKASDSTP